MSSSGDIGWDSTRSEKGVGNDVMESRTLLGVGRKNLLNKLASI